MITPFQPKYDKTTIILMCGGEEDGGKIGGSKVHFPLAPMKHLADLRNRANRQRYSSIYEDRRPKRENIERSDGETIKPGALTRPVRSC